MAKTQIANLHAEDRMLKHAASDTRWVSDVLQQAVLHHSPVQLVPDGVRIVLCWRGTFLKLTPERVELAAMNPQVAFPQAWHTVPLRATFIMENKPYSFVSRLADSFEHRSSGIIALSRPDALVQVERRSAPRRRLQQGVLVQLFPAPGRVEPAGVEPIEARLLNLSETGLACLIDDAASVTLGDGATVWVSFQLPEVEEPFSLQAEVITRTRGVGDHHVLGLEFIMDGRLQAQSALLRQSLQAISAERNCSETIGARKESGLP